MNIKIETITPDSASEILGRNDRNRAHSAHQVKMLANEIKNGRWRLNGDTIKIGSTGQLIDGQHRLMAVIDSGIAIQSLIVRGVEDDAFQTIDLGKKRKHADVLSINGEDNSVDLSSALNCLWRIESGKFSGARHSLSHTEIIDFLQRHPMIRDSVQFATVVGRIVPRSIIIALHYLFSQKSKQDADQFMVDLGRGVGLNNGDPVYTLREKMIRNKSASVALPHQKIIFLIIEAWNGRRTERKTTRLRLPSKTEMQDSFPEIK